jgi:biopolymer transport protein TolR
MADPRIAIPASEPNVTPMIDVLLVLLIAFMIVTAGARTSMDALLPQPCSAKCVASVPIVLEVLPGPSYRINRLAVAPSALLARLREIYRGRSEKIIQVAGYPGVSYADVVDAMDLAKSAGVRVIGIAPKEALAH